MIENLERDCWMLDQVIAEFALPRVLYFKNWVNRHGIPSDFYDDVTDTMYEDEWDEVLTKIVFALTYVTRDYEWHEYEGDFHTIEGKDDESGYSTIAFEPDDPEAYAKYRALKPLWDARYKEGMTLFAKYFSALWD